MGFSVVDNSLLIQMPVPLRQRNERPLSLYKVQTVHVPFNMSTRTKMSQAYTKVVLEKEYIAVEGSNFV